MGILSGQETSEPVPPAYVRSGAGPPAWELLDSVIGLAFVYVTVAGIFYGPTKILQTIGTLALTKAHEGWRMESIANGLTGKKFDWEKGTLVPYKK